MNQTMLIVYSNLGLGGIPREIIDIVNEMARSNPDIAIYILLKERRIFDLRATITNPRVTMLDFYRWCPWDNSLLFIIWMWFYIFTHSPRTILSFISPYALPALVTKILFFWRDTKIIVKEDHFTSTMIRYMAFPAIQRWGIRLLYPLADTIIVPTRAVLKDLRNSFAIPSARLLLVPNWSKYATTPIPNTHRPIDIIYTGRIEKTKNVLPLIRLLSTIITTQKPSLKCLLIGEGTQTKQCLEYITSHKLGGNISMLPPTSDVSRYLYKAKLFLFNSDPSTEGLPFAILDAMSCGAIVITKHFKGAEEVINRTSGYVVHTDDEMMARIVGSLHRYATLLPVITRAKQLAARNYSQANIHKYTRLFTA